MSTDRKSDVDKNEEEAFEARKTGSFLFIILLYFNHLYSLPNDERHLVLVARQRDGPTWSGIASLFSDTKEISPAPPPPFVNPPLSLDPLYFFFAPSHPNSLSPNTIPLFYHIYLDCRYGPNSMLSIE